MSIVSYLPSAQFSIIVSSILVSGGLVLAADYITSPAEPPSVSASPTQGGVDTKWQETLRAIQEQNPLGGLPPAPNPTAVAELLEAAQTPNITNTVARTLLINLSEAKSQGLGSDIPTQEALVANALSQIEQERGAPAYVSGDLTLSSETAAAHKTYGNGIMTILNLHPKASYMDTILAVGDAIDTSKGTKLGELTTIQAEYRAVARELAALPVPPTFVPLHLQVINDFARIAETYNDMKVVLEDPLRGLVGLQLYESLTNELGRVFINIAQAFSKNGILFSTEEPGSTWALLLQQL